MLDEVTLYVHTNLQQKKEEKWKKKNLKTNLK